MFRRGKPIVWINATNVYYRVAFPFSQLAFDALCSDLASFPVSEAVAASMAVPLFFAPIVLQKHPEACSAPLPNLDHAQAPGRSLLLGALANAVRRHRDTSKGKYIKLVDGGVTDNYGLATILQSRLLLGTAYGPMSENDAIKVRRLLFIVVDAGGVGRHCRSGGYAARHRAACRHGLAGDHPIPGRRRAAAGTGRNAQVR
nr:patatin-like phospholipase family protein [Cupriavidus sp. SK-4]